MDIKRKVHGSNSAFLWGRLVFTETKAGCLRNVLLTSRDVRETSIPEKYKILGALNEDLFEAKIKGKKEYEREVPVKSIIEHGVEFSGRIDFLIKDADTKEPIEVDELKSSDSKNLLYKTINAGHIKPEHLAQVSSYMIEKKLTVGKLIYTYYKLSAGIDGKDTYEPKSERAFDVTIHGDGQIRIDGKWSGYTVYDQLAHRKAAAHVIDTGEIWSRPDDWDVKWKSPCAFCPFKVACDKYDAGLINGTDAFVDEAKKQLIERKEKDDNK